MDQDSANNAVRCLSQTAKGCHSYNSTIEVIIFFNVLSLHTRKFRGEIVYNLPLSVESFDVPINAITFAQSFTAYRISIHI